MKYRLPFYLWAVKKGAYARLKALLVLIWFWLMPSFPNQKVRTTYIYLSMRKWREHTSLRFYLIRMEWIRECFRTMCKNEKLSLAELWAIFLSNCFWYDRYATFNFHLYAVFDIVRQVTIAILTSGGSHLTCYSPSSPREKERGCKCVDASRKELFFKFSTTMTYLTDRINYW